MNGNETESGGYSWIKQQLDQKTKSIIGSSKKKKKKGRKKININPLNVG